MKFFLILVLCLTSFGYANVASQLESEHKLTKAKAYFMEGKYQEAISCYDETILKLQKSVARQYYSRGVCYYNVGEYVKAEADFRKTIPFREGGSAEYMTGLCMMKQEYYNEAYDLFAIALEKQPDTDEPRRKFLYKYNYALAQFQVGDKVEAVKIIEDLQQKYPEEDLKGIINWLRREMNAEPGA